MKRPIAWAAAIFTLAACTTAPRPSAPEVVASAPAPAVVAPSETPATSAAPPPVTHKPTSAKSPKSAPAKPPAVAAKAQAPKAPAAAPQTASVATPPPAAPAARPAPLDLRSLEQRLKDTHAIGVMTKLSLKNEVDDLLDKFREYYRGELKTTLADLRHPYELLLMKVLSLLQDGDPALAHDINASRDAIWAVLSDRDKFFQFA